MISKNIVLIETMDSTGTGFLYPCRYEEDPFCQYFIVFTNSHVLQSIGLNQGIVEPCKDYKGHIILSFYDSLGNKVDQENIKEIRVYNSGNFMRSEEDIAALLVAVKKTVPMALETAICHRQLDNREPLYLEGYPGVLLEDEVCSRIQLEGMEKKIFPANEKLGIYQITDDYHWYNNYKDRSLLEGLFGSLVYSEKEGKSEILGMAQSVSDFQQGENPFKLMYYIKFTQILKHLREADCIIFFRETEGCYQIQWIYGKKDSYQGKKVTLLLLGGSGAGKSSFAKDFAYHGNQICSTNDGQTTRTKVIYKYRILNRDNRNEYKNAGNRVDVKILTKEEFTDRMMEKVGQRPALLMTQAIFQLKDVSIKDAVVFLENCYSLLQILEKILEEQGVKSWWPNRMLDDIRASIHHQLSNKKMIKCYEDIIETLCTYLPAEVVKYCLDDRCINELRGRCQQTKQEGSVFVPVSRESLENELLNMEETKQYCGSSADSLDVRFKEFQEAVIKAFIKKEEGGFEDEKMASYLDEKGFREAYFDSLLSIEGYFALEEFQDVFSKEDKGKLIENTEVYKKNVTVDEQKEDIDWENRSKKKQISMEFCSQMEAIYEEIHSGIKKYLIENYERYGIGEYNLNIFLSNSTLNFPYFTSLLKPFISENQSFSLISSLIRLKQGKFFNYRPQLYPRALRKSVLPLWLHGHIHSLWY